METVTYEEFDSAVFKWLKTARYSNIPISCSIFKEKALEFAKSLELNDFHASDGWVSRWKKRFTVSFKIVSGYSIYLYYIYIYYILKESLEVVLSKCL